MTDTSVPLTLINLPNTLDELLSKGNCKDALQQTRDPQNVQALKNTAWDLIPIITKHLVQENVAKHPDIYNCCVEILEEIVDKAQPEEVLLEFIEQAECTDNNIKFLALLKPMQKCLNKLPNKRGTSLQWCLNTIQNHIISLSVPENNNLEGDERKLMDLDPCYIQITNIYEAVIGFYLPFIFEVSPRSGQFMPFLDRVALDRIDSQRKSLVCFILQLLGQPLMHLDLESIGAKGKARVIAEELVNDLSGLVGDLCMFLEYTELREIEGRSKTIELLPSDFESDEVQDVFQREDKVPTLSIAVLYYLIYAEEICISEVPCVYSPLYVWQISIYLATALLKRTDSENFILRKGLLLSKSVTSRLVDCSVPFQVLDSAIHKDFTEALTLASIFCLGLETRKLSIEILKGYLFKFDMKGRYLLMSNLILNVDHSSLIGYLTMQLKDMIIAAMDIEPIPSYFCGKSLISLLKKYVALPDGVKSDLAEIRDQVLASLNILLFLFIRDKHNQTGVWDHIDCFEKWLLHPLKNAIDFSRAHYKVKLQELEDAKKTGIKLDQQQKRTGNVTLSIVGGGDLPDVDQDNMTGVVHFALNGFDLMENTLVLVEKRIENGPSN